MQYGPAMVGRDGYFGERVATTYRRWSPGCAPSPAATRSVCAELDLMAQPAGLRLRLRERWEGWTRDPLTSESGRHVSVREKPAG